MSLTIPTPEEIENRIVQRITSELEQKQGVCSVSIINAIAKAKAFEIWSAYICADSLGRTPLDARGQLLDDFGQMCGITREGCTYSSGFLTTSGNAVIPAGSILTRCDGCEYRVLEETTSPTEQLPVISAKCGILGNTPENTCLDFATNIAGLEPQAIVSSGGLVGGSDIEQESQFRSRLLACFANPCRSGTAGDYMFWAESYPGVSSVQVIDCVNGPGTVKICFAMQDSYPDGVPSQADVQAVFDIIHQNAPLGIKPQVCAVEAVTIDITIRLLGTRTSDEQNLILENLLETFSMVPIGNFCLSDIYSSINNSYNGCFELASPNESQLIGDCQIPILGDVTFIT